MREVRPLRSTGITPLPRYYEPVRLPAATTDALWFPRRCRASYDSRRTARHAGSPRTLNHSVGARPPHPPRTARWMRRLVASPSVAGFSTSGRLAAVAERNEVESGLRTLGSRLRSREVSLLSCPNAPRTRTGPLRVVSYPSTPSRSYMLNEQFTWLTPLSQLEWSGLAWRTR
jgi:hypothetical protein